MDNFIFEQGETKINNWIVNYQAPNGDKYNGKLVVALNPVKAG